jgi:hypothetical protein
MKTVDELRPIIQEAIRSGYRLIGWLRLLFLISMVVNKKGRLGYCI